MAIVLMVLAVVSLVGVGLLSQSIIDFKFASSYKSHNTAFNLADGAASLALSRVSFTLAPMYEGNAVPTLLNAKYSSPLFATQGGTPNGPTLNDRGTYWPVMIFQGPITNPTMVPGEDPTTITIECWTAQGSGKRIATGGLAASTASNKDMRTGWRLPTETSVQIALLKRVSK